MRFFLIIAIMITFIEISICCVYKTDKLYNSPPPQHNKFIFVNKLAFGLHLPFVQSTVVNWSLPHKDDTILLYISMDDISNAKNLQKTKLLIGRVIGLPYQTITIHNRRYLVPMHYIFVTTNLNSDHNLYTQDSLHFVPMNHIIGAIAKYPFPAQKPQEFSQTEE